MPLTPYFDDIPSRIIGTLSNACKSIQAVIAELTDIQILHVLRDLSVKGISIEIVINDDDGNKGDELRQLEKSGARIYYHSFEQDALHNKFCIIDGHVLIMGSCNWTGAAANSNHQSIVVVDNEPETLAHFCDEFRSLKKKLGIAESGLPVLHDVILELKTAIYFLENEIASLEVKKTEMEKLILDFETQLKIEAGDLIFEKLTLEKRLQELKAHLTQKQDDFEVLQEKQEQVHDFEKAWYAAKAKENVSLPEEDEDEMKKLYREAVMMTHPDRFMNEPEKHEEANRLFDLLTKAYQNKDFQKVREMWRLLKDGLAFKSDWFNSQDQNFFIKLLALLQKRKEALAQDIAGLEAHTVWSIRKSGNDYTAYFDQLKNTLRANISMLHNEIKKYQ